MHECGLQVDLNEIMDTMVGVPGSGLSTEQRKRLTIGVELASNPACCFMGTRFYISVFAMFEVFTCVAGVPSDCGIRVRHAAPAG